MGFQAETSYWTVNGFDLKRDDLEPQNGRITVWTINTLGEAYIKDSRHDTLLKVGSQEIDSPLMGPSDSLVVPVTSFEYRLTYTGIENQELNAIHVTKVKIRQNAFFDDIGQFVSKRLGFTPANANGTTAVGAKWETKGLKFEA